MRIPVRGFSWDPAFRVIPTRYPSIYIYDRVSGPEEFEALYALESMTNDRLREETGETELVPPEDRAYGPGSGVIMAAFTHLNPDGTRFSDGTFGVLYAAKERETAIVETRYHHGRFLAATNEPPLHLPMRLYGLRVEARLHDLRTKGVVPRAVFSPDSYAASQALAIELRAGGSHGVVYHSVRRSKGQCAGLFKPKAAANCVHLAYLMYAWDGAAISDVYEKVG